MKVSKLAKKTPVKKRKPSASKRRLISKNLQKNNKEADVTYPNVRGLG